jgi:6-phosphogluconate dehydrogenase (decarboxylating)
MIHNGIEYGMMQSFAEGLELLRGKGIRARPGANHRAVAAWFGEAAGCSTSRGGAEA